ncbi:rCG28207, isoform CRA_b, partial [Rattus norvegicus]
MCAKPVITFK